VNFETLGTSGNKSALLTAVIPAKNLLQNIDRFLKVINQPSSEQIKLVLVIDEPEDEAKRVKSALESDSRFQQIKVVYGDYKSPGTARNVGLREVKTKWVTFWDSDDEPIITDVLKTVNMANESQSEIAITRFLVESVSNGLQQSSSSFSEKKSVNMRAISRNTAIWRMSFLTDLARQSSFPNLRMGEDQVFLSRLRMSTRKIYFSNIISYVYKTENPGQLTGNKSNIKDLLSAFNLNLENLKKTLKDVNCKFESQLLAKELLTLIRNGIILAPLSILVKNSNPKIKINLAYEFSALIFTLLKKGRNTW
jgi:glycosyltransferase involved in cell wall biosynthesis